MKVFVAGATGVIGRALIPQLVAAGHEVVGMTRSATKQNLVRSLGAQPAVADALDPDEVAEAVALAEPEVIVDELTALSGPMSLRDARHPEHSLLLAVTGRLRTEGTDYLLAAGRAVGARRVVAQSFTAFRFADGGGLVLSEDDPIDPHPPGAVQPGLDAILYLEHAVTSIDWGAGVVLRYGGFYGPGTSISLDPDAQLAGPVRKRRLPIIGDGGATPRTSTSRMPPPRRSRRSSAASRGSTTSSMTSPRPCGSGCPSWPTRSAPNRRGASRAG